MAAQVITFKLKRVTQQGCLISAYLFILAIEVLANKINNDYNIQGITIDNKEIKISFLTDDITLVLNNLVSLQISLNTLKSFQRYSCLKININKIKGKYEQKLCDGKTSKIAPKTLVQSINKGSLKLF